jgi:cobalt-zinc-cadmium efflux system protein
MTAAGAHRRRLVLVFALTLSVLLVEVVGALASGSLALLADAGHLFTDTAGIGLALGAMWVAGRPATDSRTFGFLRLEIVAAAINAVLLVGVAVYVLVEAWRRFQDPPPIATGLMFAIGLAGLAANAVSVVLLRNAQAGSLNLRGAYLEVVADLAGSVAVVVAAIVIALTGFLAADPIASAFIGVLILPRTITLLRDALDILLEAVPKGVNLDELRRHIVQAEGVTDVHDLHAWTITSGMNVVSAHVVLDETADPPAVLDELCRCLSGDFDIEHSTFQLESADRRRLEEAAHV